LDVTSHNIGIVIAGLVFLFIPCVLFVAGPQWMRFGIRDTFTTEYWRAFGQVGIRGVCWFLGAVAFGVLYWPLLEWLYAN
jgi:hypothetical protein